MKLHSAVFYSKNIQSLKKLYVDFLGAKIEREQGNKFISFSILDADENKIEFLEEK